MLPKEPGIAVKLRRYLLLALGEYKVRNWTALVDWMWRRGRKDFSSFGCELRNSGQEKNPKDKK